MSKALAFIGEPLDFKGKFKIYPAKIRDIVGNPSYTFYRNIFLMTAEDIEDLFKKKDSKENDDKIPTPFEFLLINCYHDKHLESLAKEGFEFFTHETFTILYEQKIIVIGDLEKEVQKADKIEDLRTLSEEEYFAFQNAIRQSLGEKPEKPPELFNSEEDPTITRIKKRARERDRIKAKQAAKNGISLETIMTAICCMGIGITPLNIGEMSYAAIGPLMNMMQEKEKYDIDIRSLLAGADSKKVKPKYWIRNNEKT